MPVAIDCETGSYIISYNYNKILWANAIISDLTDPKEICYLSSFQSFIIPFLYISPLSWFILSSSNIIIPPKRDRQEFC